MRTYFEDDMIEAYGLHDQQRAACAVAALGPDLADATRLDRGPLRRAPRRDRPRLEQNPPGQVLEQLRRWVA